MSRSYHYVTAYYNYYFNGFESYKKGIKRSEDNFKYNFTLPIPVLLFGEQQVTGMVGGDMDRAITKATNLINKHSITVKPERKKGIPTAKEKEFYNQSEYVKWAEKSWILIGKSQAWKGAYNEATQTLEYILMQYPNTSIWYEAQIWLARISIVNNDFLTAEDKLKTLESNKKKPRSTEFAHLLSSTWAFFYTKQNKYSEAFPFLKKALENSGTKNERFRYTFLLAQLNQRFHKNEEAIALYRKILRMSPPYDILFNARISLASLYQETGKGKDMKNELIKLSRDEKNKEYLDQIYFALGNIEKSQGNIEKAIEYYKLSAIKSTENNNQKGISYLTLADYYFAKPDYKQSQAYYDSAVNSLDNNYPDYQKLETKTKYLTKLVDNLNIVNREDSLQRVANMSPGNRDALIASIIAKVQEEEQKQKQEETQDRERSILYQQNLQRYQMSQTQNQGGKWYFYNQASLSYGQSEFIMKWGRRKLEDNWRRKNKRISTLDITSDMQQQVSDTSQLPQKVLSNKSKEFYLLDLPMTDSLKALSNQRIADAMFKVGETYQNDLNDYNETVKAYELLIGRFPESPFTLQSYYNLYRMSLFTGNTPNADKYKNIIVSKFPESNYALMLSNPDYLKEVSAKQIEENAFYQETYELYQKGEYLKCSQKVDEGLARYPKTSLEPQFRFIKALCTGKLSDLRTFKEALTNIAEKFPSSDVSKSASDILVYLRQKELQIVSSDTLIAAIADSAQLTPKGVAYKEPLGSHTFIAVIPKKSNINQVKFNLVTFNVDNFINLDLSVSNQPFNEFFELIKVEQFKDAKGALEYYKAAIAQDGLFGPLKTNEYSAFVISSDNLALLLTDKSLADYIKFFKSTYK